MKPTLHCFIYPKVGLNYLNTHACGAGRLLCMKLTGPAGILQVQNVKEGIERYHIPFQWHF